MNPHNQLNKSEFITYLDCPHQFYYSCLHPDKKAATDESEKLSIENGKEFEKTVDALLDASFKPEVEFVSNNGFSRTDFVRYLDDRQVELYEVKSSKYKENEKIEDKYLYDIAFQKWVAEGAGFNVVNVFLILASDIYQYDGKEHSRELFTIVNVNKEVEAIWSELLDHIKLATRIKHEKFEPKNKHECTLKAKCSYLTFKVDLPEYHIGTLPRIGKKKFWKFIDSEMLELKDIEDASELSKGQKPYYKAYIDGRPIVKLGAIQSLLRTLQFPLYFLDYETYAPSVPILEGYGVHEKMPFQFSLHILEAPNGKLRHVEYVLEDIHSQEELVILLEEQIGNTGHVVAWNKSFEASCNTILAEKFSDHAPFLLDINNRLFDLEDFFKDKLYVDHRFKGKSSIKYVLPVLVPELTYDKLEINNGMLASYRWKKAFVDYSTDVDKEKVKHQLLEYCKLDSFAMVEVYRFLKNLS